jgi:hypothetical protein
MRLILGNPFAEYSVIYVPYCTGDAHIGDATTEYTPGLTVQHKGLANGTAALDHLVAAFPDAADVVVMGESAGSIAAPFYASLVSDRLPDARITVPADGSGAFPDGPEVSGPTSAAWGVAADDSWSPPSLFVRSWQHGPASSIWASLCEPAQLHGTGRRPHGDGRRHVLRPAGRGPAAGRLGGEAGRG